MGVEKAQTQAARPSPGSECAPPRPSPGSHAHRPATSPGRGASRTGRGRCVGRHAASPTSLSFLCPAELSQVSEPSVRPPSSYGGEWGMEHQPPPEAGGSGGGKEACPGRGPLAQRFLPGAQGLSPSLAAASGVSPGTPDTDAIDCVSPKGQEQRNSREIDLRPC